MLIVPLVWSPPFTPFTCQVTAVLLLPISKEANCTVVLMMTVPETGETANWMFDAEPPLQPSAANPNHQ